MASAFKVTLVDNGALGRAFNRRIDAFKDFESNAATMAAKAATATTRASFTAIRPANAPSRPGRPNNGRMSKNLRWKPGANGGVEFDVARAEKNPYWIIQEIGTGQSANIRVPGVALKRGGQAKAGQTSVKSQVGRRISPILAFGTGPNGAYSPPGSATGQQLYLRSRLKGAARPSRKFIIRREIKGQHMVQKGGETGFRVYKKEMYAAARQAFGGRPYQP